MTLAPTCALQRRSCCQGQADQRASAGPSTPAEMARRAQRRRRDGNLMRLDD